MAAKTKTIDVNNFKNTSFNYNSGYTTLFLKNLPKISDITMNASGNNLVMTYNGHSITLKNYFGKNGDFSIKTIKTNSSSYNLVNYVNTNNIHGTSQNIFGNLKTLKGTVFDDTIVGGDASQTISALGGNDKIFASAGNDTLIGGTGTNTIAYEYLETPFPSQNKFGKDTIKLTKGETLNLDVKYDNGDYIDLKYSRGTGNNSNDLIIKNSVVTTDQITIKDYYGKELGAKVLINGKDLTKGESIFSFNNTHIKSSSFKGSTLSDTINASKVGKQYKTVVKNKKKTKVETNLILDGGGGNDTIIGSKYNDTIKGGSGDDTITGGKGNDTITGGSGITTLYYSKGDGNDTINLTKGENLILNIDDSLNFSDLKFNHIGTKDLKISYNKEGVSGSITLKNFLASNITSGAVLNIDGKTYDLRTNQKDGNYFYEIKPTTHFTGSWLNDNINASNALKQYKTVTKNKKKTTVETNLILNGGSGNDKIAGSKYNDTINGGTGDDIITGGKGNDTVTGGQGTNIIRYSKGDGNDTINLTKGEKFVLEIDDTLNFEDLKYSYVNNNKDFKISYNKEGTSGSITLKNFLASNAATSVELKIDGETYNLKTNQKNGEYFYEIKPTTHFTGSWLNDNINASNALKQYKTVTKNKKKTTVETNLILNGGSGNDKIAGSKYNDTINGGTGNDTIIGGKGNDSLWGEAGTNTFIFSAGDGKDCIYSGSGTDVLKFTDDDFKSLQYAKSNNDLIINYGYDENGISNSSVTIKDYYKKNKGKQVPSSIKKITTKEGTLNITDAINQSANYKKGALDTTNNLQGQYVIGGNKNDILASNIDNSILYGGKGSDNITVSGADSTIYAGDGNDEIHAAGNNSTVYSGKGNDEIHGEADSKNIYVFNNGDGNDSIFNSLPEGVEDVIKFTGTKFENLVSKIEGYDVVIQYNPDENNVYQDSVRIKDYAKEITLPDIKIIGSDGVEGLVSDIKFKVKGTLNSINNITATNVNENITGGNLTDTIDAKGGDDLIYGYDGNDTITGGTGDDIIYGGKGADTLIFNNGDGNDTIYLDSDKVPDKIKLNSTAHSNNEYETRKSNNDLLIMYNNTGTVDNPNYQASIRIKDFFLNENAFAENIIIEDKYNVEKTISEIISLKLTNSTNTTFNGTRFKDYMYQKNGLAETINCGDGADYVYANSDSVACGNDIVYGGKGNDHILYEGSANSASTVTLDGGEGNDEINIVNGTAIGNLGSDTITVYGESTSTTIYGDKTLAEDQTQESGSADIINGGKGADTIYGGGGNDTINGGKGSDTIYGGDGEDTINGGDGADTIYGDKGNDIINGNSGTDTIYGGDGEDIITGGEGDDIIYGGNGADTLIFGTSDGNDTIYLGSDHILDKIKFTSVAHSTNEYITRQDNDDLLLYYHNTGTLETPNYQSSVRIKDFFLEDNTYADDMIIEDKNGEERKISSVMSLDDIYNNSNKTNLKGTRYGDKIHQKYGLAETITCSKGDDYVYANAHSETCGNDIVYGGEGNDHLFYSGSRNDESTVYLDGGEGDDTITIIKGTAVGGLGEDDIRAYGQVTIYGDKTLELDPDQDEGSKDDLYGNSAAQTIYGGGGDDEIYGGGGNDIIYGGDGDDTIYTNGSSGGDATENITAQVSGGKGADVIFGQAVKNIMQGDEGNDSITGWANGEDIFVYKAGDGADTIYGGHSGDITDTIKFSDNTTLSDLSCSFNGDDLIIQYSQNANDKITITSYKNSNQINSSIDTLDFKNGPDKSIKKDLKYEITSSGTINGTVLSDIITGSSGNDTIYGGEGDDTIYSGSCANFGKDIIYGQDGANTYVFDSNSGTIDVHTISGLDTFVFKDSVLNDLDDDLTGVIEIVGDDLLITDIACGTEVSIKDYLNSLVDITIIDNKYTYDTSTIFDMLSVTVGTGSIDGTNGNDKIIGSAEDDIIYGKKGYDTLNGKGGSDIYKFYKGDNIDSVANGTDGIIDYLYFADSDKNELTYDIDGSDLLVKYNSNADYVRIKNYFSNSNTVQKIMDSSHNTKETAYDISEINVYNFNTTGLENIAGTSLNDIITVTSGNHTIDGGKGKDIITLSNGEDIIQTSAGDDELHLGTGKTVIYLKNGSGHDKLYINALDTTPDEIRFVDTTPSNSQQVKYAIEGKDAVIYYDATIGANSEKIYNSSLRIVNFDDFYDPDSDAPMVNNLYTNTGNSPDTTITYQISNQIDNDIDDPQTTITGTKYQDLIYQKDGLAETINCGAGNDTVYAINSGTAPCGDDIIYGGKGNDSFFYISNGADLSNIYIDGGEDKDLIEMCRGTAVGGLGEDEIRIYGSGNVTVYGDKTLEQDPDQDEGDFDWIFGNSGNQTIYAGGDDDRVIGGGGNDIIYGGYGDDTIFSYSQTISQKYTTQAGACVSEIHGGIGNDKIYAQTENTIVYGDSGNDEIHSFTDLHTTIYDSSGSDDKLYLMATSNDANKNVLNIAFNVSKDYRYDEYHTTLFNGDVNILTEDNFNLWKTNSSFAGVTIKQNAIETIYDSENNTLTSAAISQLASDVATWLTSANGGAGYTDVAAALNDTNADLTELIGYFQSGSEAYWT